MEEARNKDQVLFTSLIIMFQTAAMQHMGKLKNPISDKIERDIEQAKISIDILDMIERKTAGNLAEYESKLLKSVLQELRLNYVHELDKKEEKPEKKENTQSEGESKEAGGDENEKKE